jgi:CBS domain-containing protein
MRFLLPGTITTHSIGTGNWDTFAPAPRELGEGNMRARDVMTSPVVTVKATASVKDVARLFLERRISGVPVVDDQGQIVGIVSEGDLVHRSEIGTERQHPWWLVLMAGDEGLAAEYIRAHAKRVADIMTRNVITATPDTPLHEIAEMLEKYGIKRIPIVHDEQLVGVISRANIVQAIATSGSKLDIPWSDTTIRQKLLAHLNKQDWAHTTPLNVTVNGGVVDLWGFIESDIERKAICIAAEATPGVRAVKDHMTARPYAE